MESSVRNFAKKIYHKVLNGKSQGESLIEKYDEEAVSIIQLCQPYTMTASSNLYAIIEAVRYLEENNINGSLVECGVWRGGCSMAMTETLKRLGSNRDVYLYDTFDGMSEPSDIDVRDSGEPASIKYERLKEQNEKWCYASLEDVTRNLSLLEYDTNKVHFIKGKVEDTIPECVPESIALLRLDTDWYESTKHSLEHLFPLLAVGGVLILDDYGTWAGARKAVDEYREANNIPLLLNYINKTVRVAVKVQR
ncbi:MAG: TylF/MycF/NovP-related O-methyltransferase [Bdellovibrionota bacterium]